MKDVTKALKLLKLAAQFDQLGQFHKADGLMDLFPVGPQVDVFYRSLHALIQQIFASPDMDNTLKGAILYPLREARELVAPYSTLAQNSAQQSALELSRQTQFQKTASRSGVSEMRLQLEQLKDTAPAALTGYAAAVAPKVQALIGQALQYLANPARPEAGQDAQKGQNELERDTLAQRYLAYGVKYGEAAMFQHLRTYQSEEFTNHVLNLWRDLRLQQA
jgi:hypothetical protein